MPVTRQATWLLRAIGAVLVLGMVAGLAFRFRSPPIVEIEPEKAQANAPVFSQPPAIADHPVDAATSLLGTDSSVSSEPLQLVLVDTAPGQTPRHGTATIGTDPRNPQTYAAGATLVNGAVIEEIHAKHVVLTLGGKRSVLSIGDSNSVGDATRVFGTASASQPREDVASNREDFSEIMRPQPVFEGEKFSGLQILAGRNRSKLAAMGLEPGDIVRMIDGKPLKSAVIAWQSIEDALSTQTSIVVSIERAGNQMSIYLDGSKLLQDSAQISSMGSMPPHSPGS